MDQRRVNAIGLSFSLAVFLVPILGLWVAAIVWTADHRLWGWFWSLLGIFGYLFLAYSVKIALDYRKATRSSADHRLRRVQDH